MRFDEELTGRSRTTLDPQDWQAFRERAHAMVDKAIDKMEAAAQGRVWSPVPDALKETLRQPLQREGRGDSATDQAIAELFPYSVGNTHPRFFGWVHGSGTPSGLISEIAAAAMNVNAGGRDHAAIYVERQLAAWMRDLFGFPEDASGLTVSGTSMATIVALKAARDRATSYEARADGMAGKRLVGYTSAEAHACNARAFDMLGLGAGALRKVPVDEDFRLDIAALQAAIEKDQADGLQPFVVIGTAGTVNTGSIDDLAGMAQVAQRNGLWFHVDGAFGATGILSDRLRPLLSGIELADSIAFDFHKWLHVNYDAGFVLVRDGEAHRRAFSDLPNYLSGETRGLAAGKPWPVEFGPELSRGFRALKVWSQLMEFGPERLGQAITENCAQVAYLAEHVDAEPRLERMAPVTTSICCFRYRDEALSESVLDELNREIVIQLQESGLAAPSTTRLRDKLAIRVNITNHRTRFEDIDLLLNGVLSIGKELTC